MTNLKIVIFVIMFVFNIRWGYYCISTSTSNRTAEILWNISNLGVQSRQNYGYNHYNYKYPGKYPNFFQSYLNRGEYGVSQYPGSKYQLINYPYKPNLINSQNKYYPQSPNPDFRPYTYPRPGLNPTETPFRPILNQQNFMEALDSVARNDDLRCVPKLLCEVASGTLSGSRQGFGLPFNVNMESLVGLLSSINDGGTSPLLLFGKAALLGYTSKGNTGSCTYAYPNCPSDPDRLVEYLNNHNGGFFRFFNGINPQRPLTGYRPHLHPSYYPQNLGEYKKSFAEKRIQNKPLEYVPTRFLSDNKINGIKFPTEQEEINNELSHYHENDIYRSPKTLTFPKDGNFADYINFPPFRKPKELPYPIDYYFNNNNEDLDIQKPLPNHKATPMIFPDRTGTGDLILDPEELNDNYRRPFAQQNNNIISFDRDASNDAFYYSKSNENNYGADSITGNFNNANNGLFTFPTH